VSKKLAPMNAGPWNFVCWQSSEDAQLLMGPLLRQIKNKDMAGGWMLKWTSCLVVKTHEPLHLDKRCLVRTMNSIGHTSKIHLTNYCHWWTLEYGDGRIFKLLRWMWILHQSTLVHEILYADKSSKDEKLLMISLLRKTKNTNMASGWI
jgi:hypothetical protein